MKWFATFLVACIAGVVTTTALSANADKTALSDETEARDWPGFGRTAKETHFSPLTEINRDTIGRLHLAWTFELVHNTAQSTPIAVNGIVYVASGYSVVYAVDGRTGKQLWSYDSEAVKLANRKLRAGAGIRGLAFGNGRLFVGTHDGRLVALDAKKGAVVWTAMTLDAADHSFISGAPRVCGNQVLIGFGTGAGEAVRGYVSSYDAATGQQAWRWYAVPEGRAGGSVWNAITCDVQAHRVYVGTAESRGAGDAGPHASSVVALDAANGAFVWAHRADAGGAPTDASLDITLATLDVDGAPRRVLLQSPKDGWFYVIDRDTGKRLSAKKLDLGVHTLAAQAFSPKTQLVYLPTSAADGSGSMLAAWDPVKQRAPWAIPTPGPAGGGALATAGDIVFQGQMDGYVNGYDAASGRKVWSFYAATAALGAPASFAVGGKQYVALLAGPPGGAAASLGASSAKFGWDSKLHPRRLLAFTLDASATLPATPSPTPAKPLDGPDVTVDEAVAKEGAEKYKACSWCHGANAISGGMAPDLRASAIPLDAASFATVVKGGLETRGMPKFDELGDQDLVALRQFIRMNARLVTRPNGVAPPPPEAPKEPEKKAEDVEPPKPPGSLESESKPPPQ